ncbi:spindle pole body formation-associated protein-domain-containing protein [Phyllosticta paracitricarpa]|uniref:Spindle pole body formation-associated protein-domain-containing protein n=1 Tax=Phyllosticta citricarpa TaxID=55181 RepID=A0ABR1LVD7_9PEZI
MFSWIRGPSGSEPAENPYIEPPETPAPIFAARAIKHAIFGTPQPPETVKPIEKVPAPKNNRVAALQAESSRTRPPASNDVSDQDGPKLAGILSTPGANKERKTVSFGTQVVDNEGKKSDIEARSGLPSNYPGKFPSPWTPKADVTEEVKVRSSAKLKEALYDAKTSKEPHRPGPDSKALPIRGAPAPQRLAPIARAKDDQDITIDIDQPRSESGKYWKEQYESYAKRSEKEMNKLIKRQQLAKDYARKKDAERLEVASQLETEQIKHREREKELEDKNREYKEKLRQALAEQNRLSVENATLKRRLAALESGSKEVLEDEPISDLEGNFDQPMLDPQQASLCKLDATPVSNRRRGKKPQPSPTAERNFRPRDAQSEHALSQAQSRAASVSRKPRPSRHAKSSEASDDPWLANDDSATNQQERMAKGMDKREVESEEHRPTRQGKARSITIASRPGAERTLQPLSNPSSTPKAEDARRKLAMERVAQKKRERQMGKENVKGSSVRE